MKYQFAVGANQEVSFTVGAYDPNLPLLIDPTLTYTTRQLQPHPAAPP